MLIYFEGSMNRLGFLLCSDYHDALYDLALRWSVRCPTVTL